MDHTNKGGEVIYAVEYKGFLMSVYREFPTYDAAISWARMVGVERIATITPRASGKQGG